MSFTRENSSPLTAGIYNASVANCVFDFTPTLGRLLVIPITIDKAAAVTVGSSGWNLVTGATANNTNVSCGFLWIIATSVEVAASSVDFTLSAPLTYSYQVFEYSFTGDTPTVAGANNGYTDTDVLTQTTNAASGLTSGDNHLALATFGIDTGQGNTFSSLTNSLSQVGFDFASSTNPGICTSERIDFTGVTSLESTLTITGGTRGDQMCGNVVVFTDTGAGSNTTIEVPLGPVW